MSSIRSIFNYYACIYLYDCPLIQTKTLINYAYVFIQIIEKSENSCTQWKERSGWSETCQTLGGYYLLKWIVGKVLMVIISGSNVGVGVITVLLNTSIANSRNKRLYSCSNSCDGA